MSAEFPASSELPAGIAEQYLERARTAAFLAADPILRCELLLSCIAEGDLATAGDPAVGAYHEISDQNGTDPSVAYPYDSKVRLGVLLVEALGKRGAYDSAYDVCMSQARLSDYHGVEAKKALLSSGYAGPYDELLSEFSVADLRRLPAGHTARQSRLYQIEKLLIGAAGYGIDLTVPGTPHRLLLDELPLYDTDTGRQQSRLIEIALAYHQSGNYELADHFASQVTQHNRRARMLKGMVESLPGTEEEQATAIAAIADELDGLANASLNCDRRCGDDNCSPVRDARRLALVSAGLHARSGSTERARVLLKIFDNDFHFTGERLRAYTELYKVDGREDDRVKALNLLSDGTNYHWDSMNDVLSVIAEADIAHGQVLPSLETGEMLPRIAVEITGVLSRGSSDADAYNDEHEQFERTKQLFKRSAAFSSLAISLGKYGALRSADAMIDRVERPVDRVRALAALARIYGAPELQTA
ncbi:MAG TPA: hypothetical protein VLF91_02270 [Candidatus Saccharimonadales bacterium]|nr:hypothetical protein [Candidatus Saccharimonadales bacterium]